MKKLKIKIDIPNLILETSRVKMPLLTTPRFLSPTFKIPERSKQIIQVPVDLNQGQFYIKPIIVREKLIIPEGVYISQNNNAFMEIINFSNLEQTVLFEKPIKTLPLEEYQTNTNYLNIIDSNDSDPIDIMALIRSNHLNPEEKSVLTKICQKYSNIFQREDIPLSFTNQVKHEINLDSTKPIYTRNYRYPNH